MVPLSAPARTAITAWLCPSRRRGGPAKKATRRGRARLAPSSSPRGGKAGAPHAYPGSSRWIKDSGVILGRRPRTRARHAHTLRHAFPATHLLQKRRRPARANPDAFLGHADIRHDRKIYTHILDDRLETPRAGQPPASPPVNPASSVNARPLPFIYGQYNSGEQVPAEAGGGRAPQRAQHLPPMTT